MSQIRSTSDTPSSAANPAAESTQHTQSPPATTITHHTILDHAASASSSSDAQSRGMLQPVVEDAHHGSPVDVVMSSHTESTKPAATADPSSENDQQHLSASSVPDHGPGSAPVSAPSSPHARPPPLPVQSPSSAAHTVASPHHTANSSPRSPTLTHLTPSPSAMSNEEPLSTDTLPIPPAPDTTEAEQAFHQVFNNPNAIEAAQRDDFSDSGYSESVVQSTSTSLSSSVRDFEFENGRRYHSYKSGTYLLPNDDAENEREDMKHATVLTACGQQLHFAPLDVNQPQQTRVLDMGTGTGIWCVEMADKYPSADVIGVDLSPHQPDWVPPNCRFVVDDIEVEWLHPENHFDLIHARHMAIAIKDWDHVLSSAMAALKPGGFIEFCEFSYMPASDDGTMTPDNQHLHWTTLVREGLRNVNVDLHSALTLRAKVERAGFQNVVEHIVKVPIGSWPANQLLRKVGIYMHAVLYDGLQGIAMGPLTRGLGWRPEEVELLLPGVRKDISDPSIHTYYSLHIIYGQKS
ncbi:hypothetical protein AAFC00_002811 [Neodothiora populina]|uniref:S-adenosyl-L-methionine-dependent methyltransferase n=1 Tax=Neodothiora populina TaxID=2781224 RepID=A0ABR3P8B3_9PEZI